MKTAIVIPARYASQRYPGKPLVELSLPGGERKSLIRLTWEVAKQVHGVDSVHVATDDDRIAEAARAFGADVLMTGEGRRNGTERCAEAADKLDADVILNLQGDAPLTPPAFVEALIEEMRDPNVPVATPVVQCDATSYGHFIADRQAGRVGATTAVFGVMREALYFSKEVLPWIAPGAVPKTDIPVWHHVGLYGYRRAALAAYAKMPMGRLEALEGLEQLRFLENGMPIRCVPVEAGGRPFWELNNPEDVGRIESILNGAQ